MNNKGRLAKQRRAEDKRARRRQQVLRQRAPLLQTNTTPHPTDESVEVIFELSQMGWYAVRRIPDGCTACDSPIEFVNGSIRGTTESEKEKAPTIMGLPAVIAFNRQCTQCGTLVPYFLAKDPITYIGDDRFDDRNCR